jgi:hypothetical protein
VKKLFLSLAVLFIAPIFSHGRAEAGIQWLFTATGALGILAAIGFVVDNTGWVLARCFWGAVPFCHALTHRGIPACTGAENNAVG